MNLFLCGDVMTGRGIDQILPSPCDATIYEAYLTSAIDYVELAERVSGPISRPVDFAYVWGDALAEIEARAPDLRLINLETSVTTSEDALRKGINYRMHPANVGCLKAAGISGCALANNHVLDWGIEGLIETLASLAQAGIPAAGAGRTAEEAARPAILDAGRGRRLLLFAYASTTSGVPAAWAATEARPGVNLLTDLSESTAEKVVSQIGAYKQPCDRVVVSIHWGDNWGYQIPAAQRRFAHSLVDAGVVDVLHGHSSHHPKGIEVYAGRLILYGCGDFVTDYEGIGGREEYRPELVLAYFASLEDGSGRLRRLEMVPFRSQRFRLRQAGAEAAEWLQGVLEREGKQLGTRVQLRAGAGLALRW